jgi:phosphorylcholine metabolism protein LicD
MSNSQELEILKSFAEVLEQMDISYAIGGSMASSIYGKVRFTRDADITVEPFDNQADKLFEILKPQYYISKEAMYQALMQRRSFNIIHLESAFKIDIFIRKDTAFEKP